MQVLVSRSRLVTWLLFLSIPISAAFHIAVDNVNQQAINHQFQQEITVIAKEANLPRSPSILASTSSLWVSATTTTTPEKESTVITKTKDSTDQKTVPKSTVATPPSPTSKTTTTTASTATTNEKTASIASDQKTVPKPTTTASTATTNEKTAPIASDPKIVKPTTTTTASTATTNEKTASIVSDQKTVPKPTTTVATPPPTRATTTPPSGTTATTAAATTTEKTSIKAPSGNLKIGVLNYKGQVASTEADEYIEVVNNGKTPIDLSGIKVVVATTEKGPSFEFPPSTVVKAGSFVRVYTNEIHKESGGYSFGYGKAIWNNKGGKAILTNSQGQILDTYSY